MQMEEGEGENMESVALTQILHSVVQVGSKVLWCGSLFTQNCHSVCKPLAVEDP